MKWYSAAPVDRDVTHIAQRPCWFGVKVCPRRFGSRPRVSALLGVLGATLPASAVASPEDESVAGEGELVGPFDGPFPSAHLFEMPTSRSVGAYQMSLSYDGSLLAEPGILSSAGLWAIGFGELAQLEYRHTSAISVTGSSAPLPAAGVHFVLPLPDGGWPTAAIAVRGGLPREESFDGFEVTERATDVYVVAGYSPPLGDRPLTLHASARITRAEIDVTGAAEHERATTLVLPAAGFEWRATDASRFVGEVQLSPRFVYDLEDLEREPTITDALQGRLGLRWRVIPALSLDASFGYRFLGADNDDGLFLWDIRLGGEVHVAWDAVACKVLSVLCRRKEK